MGGGSRGFVGACLIGIVGASATAWAGPPQLPVQRPTGMPSVEEAETIMAAVRIVDARARVAFEAGEYAAAAEQWEHAHALMGMEIGLDVERQEIAYQLAHAHIHANSTDNDAQRLERARTLLWGYVAHLQRPEHTPTAEERDRIDRSTELIEIVEYRVRDARIREIVQRELPDVPEARRRTRQLDKERAGILIGAGASGMVVGVLGMALGGVAVKHGQTAAAGVGLGLGGAFLAAGAITLGVGMDERRRVRASPTFARGSAGVALSGRF
jgi:hypothetical protein